MVNGCRSVVLKQYSISDIDSIGVGGRMIRTPGQACAQNAAADN
jgi:hypothetical protein